MNGTFWFLNWVYRKGNGRSLSSDHRSISRRWNEMVKTGGWFANVLKKGSWLVIPYYTWRSVYRGPSAIVCYLLHCRHPNVLAVKRIYRSFINGGSAAANLNIRYTHAGTPIYKCFTSVRFLTGSRYTSLFWVYALQKIVKSHHHTT